MADNNNDEAEDVARIRCLQWRYLDFLVTKLENSKRYTINSEIMSKLDEISTLENEVKELRIRLAKKKFRKNVSALKNSGNSAEKIRDISRRMQLRKNRIKFKNGNKWLVFSSPLVQLKRKFSGEGLLFSADSKKMFESILKIMKMKKDRKNLEDNVLAKANSKLTKLAQKYEFYQIYSAML